MCDSITLLDPAPQGRGPARGGGTGKGVHARALRLRPFQKLLELEHNVNFEGGPSPERSRFTGERALPRRGTRPVIRNHRTARISSPRNSASLCGSTMLPPTFGGSGPGTPAAKTHEHTLTVPRSAGRRRGNLIPEHSYHTRTGIQSSEIHSALERGPAARTPKPRGFPPSCARLRRAQHPLTSPVVSHAPRVAGGAGSGGGDLRANPDSKMQPAPRNVPPRLPPGQLRPRAPPAVRPCFEPLGRLRTGRRAVT